MPSLIPMVFPSLEGHVPVRQEAFTEYPNSGVAFYTDGKDGANVCLWNGDSPGQISDVELPDEIPTTPDGLEAYAAAFKAAADWLRAEREAAADAPEVEPADCEGQVFLDPGIDPRDGLQLAIAGVPV